MEMMLALAAAEKYLPGGLMVRLARNYPDIRDLGQRLLHLPQIKRGNFVNDLPKNDDGLIKYADRLKYSLYYGYRVYKEKDKDALETLLMCVDAKGRVVEPEQNRLDSTVYYVGIRIPTDDIASRRYANKFNRMDYIKDR
uniref:Virion structural protein n=1 Tax=Pseudomonas phage HRDY3 TaxID=3236930 RepID=A0AB39CE19_9VIRU